MTTGPLVSICIPTFNGARFLKETLESVLAQSYPNLEILISDHSSTDKTIDVIKSYVDERITLNIHPPGGGAQSNWNAAVEGARGTYIKVLCQDDLLEPDCIAEQVSALEIMTKCSFCFSPRDILTPRGRKIIRNRGFDPDAPSISLTGGLPTLIQSGTNIFGEPCSVLIRASALDQVGPFTGSYLIDLNMWVSLWEIGDAAYVPKSLSQFRISSGSWTMALKDQQSRQVENGLRDLKNKYPDIVSESDLMTGLNNSRKLEKKRQRIIWLVEFLKL